MIVGHVSALRMLVMALLIIGCEVRLVDCNVLPLKNTLSTVLCRTAVHLGPVVELLTKKKTAEFVQREKNDVAQQHASLRPVINCTGDKTCVNLANASPC